MLNPTGFENLNETTLSLRVLDQFTTIVPGMAVDVHCTRLASTQSIFMKLRLLAK
jgi:hypothetical protein